MLGLKRNNVLKYMVNNIIVFKNILRETYVKIKFLLKIIGNFLRIPWKDMFSNTKDWIHVAKTFIDNVSTYVLERDGYVM